MNRRQLGRHAGAATLLLVALSLGRVVQTAFPVESRIAAPFERSGVVGEPVALRFATVTATEVTGSTRITAFGKPMATTGVWVVVPLAIDAVGEPVSINHVAVRGADGQEYLAGGTRSPFLSGTAQPGVTRYVTVAVEMPTAAAVGARLVVGPDWDLRGDDLAVIDLGITREQVDAWAETTESHPVDLGSETPSERIAP